jgi:HEAT repeat protein
LHVFWLQNQLCAFIKRLKRCAFTSQLQDKDDNARKEAVKALGELADPRAIEPLIEILKDWKVQTETVQALVKIGEPAIDPLIEVLKDENWRIRKGAVQALGEIGVPRAVAPLLGALKDHDSDVQKEAVRALGKIGEPAIAPLLAALKNEDDDVQKGAMQALEEIGEPAVESFLEWAVDLKKRGEIQQAEQVLVNLWDLREFDQQQAIAVGLTENELMKALGQSTGAYAQELMEAALSKACQGQSSESVALANSGTHRAMVL